MITYISASERNERIRATRGFIGESGIVICGGCFDAERLTAAGDVLKTSRLEAEAWQPFNPQSGDDFCSVCDADIISVHPSI